MPPGPVADQVGPAQALGQFADAARGGVGVFERIAQPGDRVAQPVELLRIGEVQQRETLVVFIHAGVDEARHREAAHARGHAGGRDVALRDHDQHRVADPHAQRRRQAAPGQDAPGARLEFVQSAAAQVAVQGRDRALFRRQHRAQFDGRGALPRDQHAAAFDEGRDGHDAGLASRMPLRLPPAVQPSVLALERRVRDDVEDALLQVLLEAVHDREHGDQRRDAERDPGHRDARDEADESVVALRAQVAQPDPPGPARLTHSAAPPQARSRPRAVPGRSWPAASARKRRPPPAARRTPAAPRGSA